MSVLDPQQLQTSYDHRFLPDLQFRQQMWRVLCARVFQRYVSPEATVLDLGAGYCEFINAIRAARRVAIDLRPSIAEFAAPGVEVLAASSTDLAPVSDGSVDVVFASHFLEHLTRGDILKTLGEVRRVLSPGGRFLILQPNYRYCYRDYWMTFDHLTPLDDRSLAEVLQTTGFRVETMIPRFLPYTTRGRLPKSLLLLKIYLAVPLLWRFFGGTALAVATPC
jgi:SAM-dependent methyltransferase